MNGRLETSSPDEKTGAFEQILPETLRLCGDVFGNYVVQKFMVSQLSRSWNIM